MKFTYISNNNIYNESQGKNINRIYYYNPAGSTFDTGSVYYFGWTRTGSLNAYSTGSSPYIVTQSFADLGGGAYMVPFGIGSKKEFNYANWRLYTSSNLVPGEHPDTFLVDLRDSYVTQLTSSGIMMPYYSGATYYYNKVYIEATGSSGDTSWANALTSENRWALRGNFDIQVDFEDLSGSRGTGNESIEFGLAVLARPQEGSSLNISAGTPGNKSKGLKISADRINFGAETYFYLSQQINSGTFGYQQTEFPVMTFPLTGKLRIVRNNNTASFYYWSGVWSQIGANQDITTCIGSEDVIVSLVLNPSFLGGAKICTRLANFTINSVDQLITQSGWYLETGSSQHSNSLTMSNGNLVIGSDNGIDIYDTVNNGLWSRFYTGSENALILSGDNTQRPLDFCWTDYGQLYCAYGAPAGNAGGLLNIDYQKNKIELQVSTGSYKSLWKYNVKGNITFGSISERNSATCYHSRSNPADIEYKSNWGIHQDSVLSVDAVYSSSIAGSKSFYDSYYTTAATREGLRVFKRNLPLWTAYRGSDATGSSDAIPLNTRYRYCKFNKNTLNLYYTSDSTIYYITRDSLSSSFTSSNTTSQFSSTANNTLLGTRTLNSQYRFVHDSNNNIYIPASEGIYKLNEILSSNDLYVARGGALFNILNTYDLISSLCIITGSTADYLYYGYSNGSDYGLGVVAIYNNGLAPKFMGNQSLSTLVGASEIKDIEFYKKEFVTTDTSRFYNYVAFTSSIYQVVFDINLTPYIVNYSEPSIGSDFTINNLKCLPYQYYNSYGDSLEHVPYFLNTPGMSLRHRKILLSSSITKK